MLETSVVWDNFPEFASDVISEAQKAGLKFQCPSCVMSQIWFCIFLDMVKFRE